MLGLLKRIVDPILKRRGKTVLIIWKLHRDRS